VNRKVIEKALGAIASAEFDLRHALDDIKDQIFEAHGSYPDTMTLKKIVAISKLLLTSMHSALNESQEEKGPPITRPAQAEGGSWKC
jgi:hypothetical protein